MGITSIVGLSMVNEGIGDSTSLSVARTTGVVKYPITLNVPSDFSTLQDAMNWIEEKVLLAEVTIQIADGTYNHSSGVGHRFDHPNYRLVNIVGNTSTPSNVTFNFSGSAQAFRVNACTLKSLKGIKLSGGTYGVMVHQGGTLLLCQSVEITGFTTGPMWANDRSLIESVSCNIYNNSSGGVQSLRNSYIYGQSIISNNSSNGWGFYAEYGGGMGLNGYTATGNSNGVSYPAINNMTSLGGVITG